MDLVDTPHVSEFTKKTLGQFGWKDGDAIPAELGPMLVKLRETLPPSPRTDVLVDVAALPPATVEEIKQMLAAARVAAAAAAKQRAADAAMEHLNPAAQQLLRTLKDDDATPQIIDDRATVTDAATEPRPEERATPPEVPATSADTTGTTPMAVLPFCPRCGWDMRQRFEIVPTDLDKEDFLAAALGGTKFKRDYPMFGGKMVVMFNTILADENKMIHRQLVLDQESKRIVTEAEWFVQMLEYRMALSLVAIVDANGKPTAVVPALGELPAVDGESPIVTLTNYVNTKVLAHEVTRRLVGQHLRQFQRLVEALEAMALEPSFWNGIA
jgi:hypothetical protein